MCGRYNIVTNAEALIDAFEIIHSDDSIDDFLPNYNIAPSDAKTLKKAPIVYLHDHQRSLTLCCWPFLPAFAHAVVGKYCVANAQMEKLEQSKVYGSAWKSGQRCLVPASGFYEWQIQTKKGPKQPYNIKLKDQELFAMAGVRGVSSTKDGSVNMMSFAIITLPANPLMAEIHNDKKRMPALLSKAQQQVWLGADNNAAMDCIKQYPQEKMSATPITTYLNNPNNIDVRCLDPLLEH
ncbi:MAG: SOS response-associated peptidase [Thiohalomonadales bacterium]